MAKKQPAVTEEQVQEKLRMRRQESFLRKAAVLDSIGKYDDGDENILVESSRTKKKQGRPSALVDRRMDASEESFVWTRSKDADTTFSSTLHPRNKKLQPRSLILQSKMSRIDSEKLK